MDSILLPVGRLLLGTALAAGAGLMGYFAAFVAVHSLALPSAFWLHMTHALGVGMAAGLAGAVAWAPDDEARRGRLLRFGLCAATAVFGAYIGVKTDRAMEDAQLLAALRWLFLGGVLGANIAGLIIYLAAESRLVPFRLISGWLTGHRRRSASNGFLVNVAKASRPKK